MQIIVTGATGFVGSHIMAASWPEGAQITPACRRPEALPAALRSSALVGDLCDPAYRSAIASQADVVCHAASIAHFEGHAEEERKRYLDPTLALIDACAGSRVRRFVNLSSISTRVEDRGDPLTPGKPTHFWPHIDAVIQIENHLRQVSGPQLEAVNLRCGFFVGARYNLGLLPALLPRLRTHLVPWVDGGRASVPLVAGTDIAKAFVLGATKSDLSGFTSVNIVGPVVPTMREVLSHLHQHYGVPLPHFGVSYTMAHAFGATMEWVGRLLRREPFLTRGIVHLLRETHASGREAEARLGYRPAVHWTEGVAIQMQEMRKRMPEVVQ